MRWIFILFIYSAAAVPAGAFPTLYWAPADTTIEPGQEATLSIMLDDTLEVRTIELYISYDSSVITSVSGGPGALFDGFNLFSGFQEVDPGEPGQWHGYSVVLGADDWAVGPGELFSWTVRGDTLGVSSTVVVTVTLLPPGGGDYDTVVLQETDITVALPTAVPNLTADGPFLSLSPNPFNPRVRIAFDTGGLGEFRLEVFDLRGRKVVTLRQGAGGPVGRVDWDGRDAQGRTLPSGVYTFSLRRADGSRATTRGTLLR